MRMLPLGALLLAQAMPYPAGDRAPTLEETRAGMGIPSRADQRGQLDAVGFASTAEQMKLVWDLSAEGPDPEKLGPLPPPGVLAAVSPHDDYLYAGRVYRRVLPLVTARTVVVVGVFHRYRTYRVRDRLVFDPYPTWRTPDGPVRVSELRETLLERLPEGDVLRDANAHDSEHSVEAEVYWLRHIRPDVEIVPILVPATSFQRLTGFAERTGAALASWMRAHHRTLGKDVAIVISADAVHYGADFKHVPFGEGGVEAYTRAVDRDRDLLRKAFAGPLTVERARTLYEAFVDPGDPDTYRLTWCGRFSIPFGMLLLRATSQALGMPVPEGKPVAYATSVGAPELRVRASGLGETAPANLYHFVGYPAVVW
ncbi:MAG TPA: AmmeMemoRadiSam system protein B [Candidatus Polarisedimenticolaceae bacterium]|nr:AmmeMemoRadiSam system protein B [Candidatus Polarisedimenticolaceae bacterium]